MRPGYHLSPEQLKSVFEQFKDLADKKKVIYDSDIAALCDQQIREAPESWTFVSYELLASSDQTPKVKLTLRHGEEEMTQELADGDGPVDAVFLLIERMTGVSVVCKDFQVHSVSVGKDAQAEVTIEADYQGHNYRGRGISTDSVEASAKAFLDAINRIAAIQHPIDRVESQPATP